MEEEEEYKVQQLENNTLLVFKNNRIIFKTGSVRHYTNEELSKFLELFIEYEDKFLYKKPNKKSEK